jgi:hypothetical protein
MADTQNENVAIVVDQVDDDVRPIGMHPDWRRDLEAFPRRLRHLGEKFERAF